MSDKDKIFIPMSIDQNSTTKSSYFSSPLKLLASIGGVIPGIPFSLYAYTSTGDSYLGLGIGILLYAFLYSYILRFIVFEERRLKKMMRTLDENKISKSEYFWGIDEIDRDGVIHYRYNVGLKKAVIVKVVRGSTVGVSPDFDIRFKDCNLKFVRGLLSQNFSYMKYTKLEKKQLPVGVRDYTKRLETIRDDAQRAVVKLNIDVISNFIKDNKSVVVDYYIVYNRDVRLMKNFRAVVRDAMVSAFSNEVYFRGTKVLNDDECAEFIADVLNVRSVNKSGYYNLEDYSFEDFGEVYRLFDTEGNEVLIDLEKEVKSKSQSRVSESRGGKTIDQLEEEVKTKLGYYSGDLEDFEDSNEDYEETDIIVISDDDIDNYDDDEYEIVYVDEDGNEISDYTEEEKEEYDLDRIKDIDIFSITDKKDIPKKK